MEKISIIGASCLFPDAFDKETYWKNLVQEKDATSLLTEKFLDADPSFYYDPQKGKADKIYYMKGGYIKDFKFNPEGYRIPPERLEKLDTSFKWGLYVSREALKDSGYLNNNAVLEKCGLILGCLATPTISSYNLVSPMYLHSFHNVMNSLLGIEDDTTDGKTDSDKTVMENFLTLTQLTKIIPRALSLSGPSFTLEAACASSLFSLKIACDYLASGKTDLMLAGALNCAHPLFTQMEFSLFQAYPPPDQESRPMDKTSEGLVSSQGAGMVVLKRHRDAIRDGDYIYGSILATGLSNDGKGKHLLQPNEKGQLLCFERAYENAGISPSKIDYIECHMTGTPVGDRTEIDSMEKFFGVHRKVPKIGSVKSNIGHSIVAAGMAGLLKVLYSIKNNKIPATIKLRDPIFSSSNIFTPEHIVKSLTPWPEKQEERCAAVSCFGFGGNNAHLVLREEKQGKSEDCENISIHNPENSSDIKFAITGMDAHFGEFKNLDEFNNAIYNGKQCFNPLPRKRWKGFEQDRKLLEKYGFHSKNELTGAFIQDFEIDFFNFKIPATFNEQPIPEQLLLLKVADNALRDSAIEPGANVAVIIATETSLETYQYLYRSHLDFLIEQTLHKKGCSLTDPLITHLKKIYKESICPLMTINKFISYIGNIIANRISNIWDFSGPSFIISEGNASFFRTLEIAQLMLTNKEVESVLVGAVDLAGAMEKVLLQNTLSRANTGTKTLSFDKHSHGWLIGEGAGAVVLKNLKTARQKNEKVYAQIDSVNICRKESIIENRSERSSPRNNFVTGTCEGALKKAGITARDIDYLEVNASGIQAEDDEEVHGLVETFKNRNAENPCVLGSIKTNVGHTFVASGAASFIKTALCLSHKYLPATPKWSGFKDVYPSDDSIFSIPKKSLPWNISPKQTRRVAAINALADCSVYTHVILSELLPEFNNVLKSPADSEPSIPENLKVHKGHHSMVKRVVVGADSFQDTILTEKNRNLFRMDNATEKNTRSTRGSHDTVNDLFQTSLQLKSVHYKYLHMKSRNTSIITNLLKKTLNNVTSDTKKIVSLKKTIFSEADLLEFAKGKIGNVLGDAYKIIDSYPRRVRLPMPPFLFVSRITEINAALNSFKPCSIETEYDIPHDAWYLHNGQIPSAILVEAAQGILFLVSFLGFDLRYKGERLFRALSSNITYYDDMPAAGDTIRYKTGIDTFLMNDEHVLLYSNSECFVEDKCILKMELNTGFFSDGDLQSGKGIKIAKIGNQKKQKTYFKPLLSCPKNSFNTDDIVKLSDGDFVGCFGANYIQKQFNPGQYFFKPPMRMVDRIVNIDVHGGEYGLGMVISEKDLHVDDWYFKCHFKDDYCMPGNMIGEGGLQTLAFYMLYIGLHKDYPGARFQPFTKNSCLSQNRGQITPTTDTLTYQVEITDIGLSPRPCVRCNVKILFKKLIIEAITNMGVQLK